MHSCPIHQEQSQHNIQMFLTAMQDNYPCSPYSDHTRCLDTHHCSYGPSQHHNPDMPREIHGNNCYLTTATHTEYAYCLQCHFISFLTASTYETPVLNVKCITQYGESPNDKHHCCTLPHMATLRKQSQ